MGKIDRPITPRFYVHPKSKEDSRPVIMTAYSGKILPKGRFQYSTGVYVDRWEKRKGKKGLVTDLNDMLKNLLDTFKEAVNEHHIYDAETLKAKMDYVRYGIEEKVNKPLENIVEFAEDYLKVPPVYYSESRKEDVTMLEGTLRAKKQSIKTLKDFQDYVGFEITFENFDTMLWEKFRRWMKDKGFSPAYAGKNVKDIKSFFNRAKSVYKNSINICLDYQDRGTAPIGKSEKKIDAYLNEAEIKTVANLELEDPRLANSRDMLLTLCALGLRVSDALKLTPKNIIMKSYGRVIRVRTQKTGELVIIPTNIFPWFEAMMERRGWTFPEPDRIQQLNTDFRTIAEKAKLDRMITSRIRRGNRFSVIKDLPLYEAVSSHIGRRSFVSNLIHSDTLKASQIMSLTGHLRAEMIEAYNQLDKEKIAEQIAHKFPNSILKVS